MLIIDGISYLPMDIQGTNLFFQLIARRYEKPSAVFTSNKTFSQWNEIFANVTIISAILDRVLYHCTNICIKGESYRLKEGFEFMIQKQQEVIYPGKHIYNIHYIPTLARRSRCFPRKLENLQAVLAVFVQDYYRFGFQKDLYRSPHPGDAVPFSLFDSF